MNLVIPPLIFYVVGFALVIGGAVRALILAEGTPPESSTTTIRARRPPAAVI